MCMHRMERTFFGGLIEELFNCFHNNEPTILLDYMLMTDTDERVSILNPCLTIFLELWTTLKHGSFNIFKMCFIPFQDDEERRCS
jgi:hypothetical protein